jgi:hypothetical protein
MIFVIIGAIGAAFFINTTAWIPEWNGINIYVKVSNSEPSNFPSVLFSWCYTASLFSYRLYLEWVCPEVHIWLQFRTR